MPLFSPQLFSCGHGRGQNQTGLPNRTQPKANPEEEEEEEEELQNQQTYRR
jgi:hypothetical protein